MKYRTALAVSCSLAVLSAAAPASPQPASAGAIGGPAPEAVGRAIAAARTEIAAEQRRLAERDQRLEAASAGLDRAIAALRAKASR